MIFKIIHLFLNTLIDAFNNLYTNTSKFSSITDNFKK